MGLRRMLTQHRWSASEKLWIVEETVDGRRNISVVARRHGVTPSQVSNR